MTNCTTTQTCQGYTEARIVSAATGANIATTDTLIKQGPNTITPGVLVSTLLDGTGGIGSFSAGKRQGQDTLITIVRDNADYEFTFASAGIAKIVPTDNFDRTATHVWGGHPKPTQPGGTTK